MLSVFTTFVEIVDAMEHPSLQVPFLVRIAEPLAPATHYQLLVSKIKFYKQVLWHKHAQTNKQQRKNFEGLYHLKQN